MMGMAAAVLLSSCVKNTLYDTPHPDYGKIAVTADWSARGEGIDIPATWTVTLGDYTGTETSATHAPDHLFAPGSYTLAVWNPAEGITVSGTTATIAAATGNRAGTDAFVNNTPGWFFTYTEQLSIEKDKDYPLTAAMKQQVRELTLVVEPTGDAAGRITEIVAHLTGAAGTLDFATDTYGAASNVVLPFTKITEGADAGKWKATVRLLGVTGTEQLLTGEIRYADGNPTPTTLKSDLTEALKEFNAKKSKPLTLGGTLVETPEGIGMGCTIGGWEHGQGESGAAEDLGYNYDTTTKTYTVYNADGLLAWAEATKSDLSIDCTLTADIDLTGKMWTPIGNGVMSKYGYQGTFDGQGHRITGLAITTDNPQGESAALFGGIGGNGEVKNLQLVDVDFNVIQNGVASGIAMSNYGTITACSVTGDISATGGYVGGIATSNIGSIIGCWFDGNLTSGLGNGGIAALNYSTITACYYGQNGYPGVAINDGTADTYQIDTGTSWQPAVDGMNPALTDNDYQWALGTDGLPVLQKKQ